MYTINKYSLLIIILYLKKKKDYSLKIKISDKIFTNKNTF